MFTKEPSPVTVQQRTGQRRDEGEVVLLTLYAKSELDNLIDSSLTYARFEREAPEPHFSTVAFAEWLQDEVDAVRLLGLEDAAVERRRAGAAGGRSGDRRMTAASSAALTRPVPQ